MRTQIVVTDPTGKWLYMSHEGVISVSSNTSTDIIDWRHMIKKKRV